MRNIEFQVAKEVRPETNPKSILLKEHDNFLNTFSKKYSDIYQIYNHKIILEKEYKHQHVFLYKMSLKEHDAVKYYFDLYLAKKFIQASLTYYLFIK